MKKIFYSLLLVTCLATSNTSGAQCTDSFFAFSQTACDSYTVPSGDEIYTIDGIYMDTIPNFEGCDSILTITLDISYSSTSSINVTECDTYTVPSGDETYTTSGIYTDTIPNLSGCDSVITIDLTILTPTFSSINITACDMYTVPSSDTTYTINGTYTDTIPNFFGCDSIITINLTLNYSTGSLYEATSCFSHTYNSQTYTSTGIYTQTFTNSVGCDSIVTLDLTIHQVDISVAQTDGTLEAAETGVWFQWVDCNDGMEPVPGAFYREFTPTVSGSYAVIVMTLSCTDTSACYDIDDVGIAEENDTKLFAIYPNPTTGEFTLSFLNPVENATVRVVSLSGQILITETNVNGTTLPLNISGQADGVYILEVTTESSLDQIRILKK